MANNLKHMITRAQYGFRLAPVHPPVIPNALDLAVSNDFGVLPEVFPSRAAAQRVLEETQVHWYDLPYNLTRTGNLTQFEGGDARLFRKEEDFISEKQKALESYYSARTIVLFILSPIFIILYGMTIKSSHFSVLGIGMVGVSYAVLFALVAVVICKICWSSCAEGLRSRRGRAIE